VSGAEPSSRAALARGAAFVLVCVWALILCAPGLARADWSAASTVSATGGGPQVASLPGGGAVAVWLESTTYQDPSFPGEFHAVNSIHAASRTGAVWSMPALIVPDAPPPMTASAQAPIAVAGPDGSVTVTWSEAACYSACGHVSPEPTRETIKSITRSPQGVWGSVQSLSTPATSPTVTTVGSPLMGVAADGTVVVAWVDLTVGDPGPIEVATRPPGAASTFGAPQPVAGSAVSNGGRDHFSLGVAPDGGVAVVWQDSTTLAGGAVHAAVRAAGVSGFSVQQPISPGNNVNPAVAMASGGKVVALFSSVSSGARYVFSTTLPAGASPATGWTTPVVVSTDTVDSDVPDYAVVAPDGTVRAIWRQHAQAIVATEPPAATAFDVPVAVSGPFSATAQVSSYPVIAAGLDGSTAAAWSVSGGVRAATLAPGATDWAPSPALSSTGRDDPAVSVDPAGLATVVWDVLPADGNPGSPFRGIEAATSVGASASPPPGPGPLPGPSPNPGAAPPPPNTTITSGPGAGSTTRDRTPTFKFGASVAGATFTCSLDAGPFSRCSGPGASHTTAPLRDGSHTFRVRGILAGATDPTPASRTFTVDATPPQTRITKGPAARTRSRTATFRFSSSDRKATFRCSLDRKRLAHCTSAKSYKRLAPGKHTFSVLATDRAGNPDKTAAKRSWTITR
jgi:hypothetical protein